MKHVLDTAAAQRAVRAFLEALGYDCEQPDLAETPARVVEAYVKDLTSGENVDIARLLEQGSIPNNAKGIVVVRDIRTVAMCPHHLLPAQGSVTVAYLPGSRVLGLGTLASLVDAYSRRLTLQEHIGEAVTRALMDQVGARGAYCQLRFDHACLRLRGARQGSAIVETVHVEGLLAEPPHSQHLALLLGSQASNATS